MSDNGAGLQTPAAKVMPKIQYTNLLFSSFFKFVDVCGGLDQNPQSIQKRIEILTVVLINFIPSPVERKRLKESRKERIHAIKAKGLDLEDTNDEILEINTDIVGEVMELCDDFLAIMERQSVMATIDSAELDKLEKKFYPNGLPDPSKAHFEETDDEVA
ncbi:MAG: hypothetical protein M0R51_05280 [Clostridia bacterium]|jgi:hypothetical protein|nr:hypothetical protein [Clostridia bacterium]